MLTKATVTVQERLIEQLSQVVSAAMLAEGKQKRAAIRQLMCKVQEIRTTLLKHLAKEEEQLFPLLLKHFTYSEQARSLPLIPTLKHLSKQA
jgi:zinc finger-like protein